MSKIDSTKPIQFKTGFHSLSKPVIHGVREDKIVVSFFHGGPNQFQSAAYDTEKFEETFENVPETKWVNVYQNGTYYDNFVGPFSSKEIADVANRQNTNLVGVRIACIKYSEGEGL